MMKHHIVLLLCYVYYSHAAMLPPPPWGPLGLWLVDTTSLRVALQRHHAYLPKLSRV